MRTISWNGGGRCSRLVFRFSPAVLDQCQSRGKAGEVVSSSRALAAGLAAAAAPQLQGIQLCRPGVNGAAVIQ